MEHRIRATWIVPDDYGGGVISVVQGCCREAARAGYEATLLLLLPPGGHADEFGGVAVETLGATPPYADAPRRFIEWLKTHPQDVVFLNGCEQADSIPPFVPAETRVVYVVHDTAPRYYEAALAHEDSIDAIIAVSETVAACFRSRLRNPRKLEVVHNGSVFPIPLDALKNAPRADDLIFLGGDKRLKGASDVLALWPSLRGGGFRGRLHWFGAIDESLHTKVNALEGNEDIVLHGRVARSIIFETALRAKVCLTLSRSESFGMATVECMGMGCGVAAWNIDTGTKEIVSGDSEGVFASLGDTKELVRAIMDMLALNDAQRFKVAKRIREVYGEEAMWRRYSLLLSRLMTSPVVARPKAGAVPPLYTPPRRLFQKLPRGVRNVVRDFVGRSPILSHALRNMRGL